MYVCMYVCIVMYVCMYACMRVGQYVFYFVRRNYIGLLIFKSI